jgi:hypothetical protein
MDQVTLEERVNEIVKTPYDDRKKHFAKLFQDILESSGFSVREIAHQTRISLSFLDAFVQGDLDKLPGEVFGRGFLRNICKLMNMEHDSLVKAYNACLDDSPSMGQPEIKPVVEKKSLEKKVAEKTPPSSIAANEKTVSDTVSKMAATASTEEDSVKNNVGLKWLIPVVGAAAALTLVLWPTQNEQDTIDRLPYAVKAMKNANLKRPAEIAVNETVQDTLETNPLNSQVELNAADISQVPTETSDEFQSETAAFEQVVEIKVLEPVKIKKTIDGGDTVAEQLDPKTYRFNFDENAEFLIYDAAAVQVNFNGRPLGDLGSKGRIRRVSFAKKPENSTSM